MNGELLDIQQVYCEIYEIDLLYFTENIASYFENQTEIPIVQINMSTYM